MLAALDRSHPVRELAHALRHGGDLAGFVAAFGLFLEVLKLAPRLGEDRAGVDAPGGLSSASQVVARRQPASDVRDDETERIAHDGVAYLDLPQGTDRLPDLAAVGSEAEHQAGSRVEDGDRDQVGRVKGRQHEVGRRLLGAADRVGSRVEQVEEQKEVAAGGHGNLRLRGLALDE